MALFILAIRAYLIFDFPGKRTWNGKDNLNILVVGIDEKGGGYKFVDAIILVRISPEDEAVGVLAIDPDISFLDGDRKLTFQKAYNTKNSGDFSLLKKGLTQALALQVDKYIAIDEEGFVELDKLFSSVEVEYSEDKIEKDYEEIDGDFLIKNGVKSYEGLDLLSVMATDEAGIDKRLDTQDVVVDSFLNDFSGFGFIYRILRHPNLLNSIETNLSRGEALDIYSFLRKGSKIEKKFSYTKQNSLIIEDDEKGEKQVLWERVSQDIQAVCLDEKILQEQVRLEVLNGTDQAGLAARYKRSFENSGLRVVREDNTIKQSAETILYLGDYGEKEHTVNFIKSVFGDKIQVKEEAYKYKHIGDMVLVLGNDLAE